MCKHGTYCNFYLHASSFYPPQRVCVAGWLLAGACVRRDGCSQARVCGARAPRSHLVTHTHPHTYDVAETEEIFSREEEFTAHMTVRRFDLTDSA